MEPGTMLDIGALGVRVHIRRTAAQTRGELVEFDVEGRPRGLIAAAHVHTAQAERHEVLDGAMRLVVGGRAAWPSSANSRTSAAPASGPG